MRFDIKDLKKFLYSIQNNNIQQINIRSNNLELCINKHKPNNNHVKQNFAPLSKLTTHNKITNKIISTQSNLQKNIDKNESEIYSTIISPMVGTFYRSPAPNEPVFIKKHDIVQKKQIVCIVEAMKLMNEIEAEVNGEIVDFLVNDGDIVDCGQALMKVKVK